jgi:hypothetical protein
MPTDPDLAVFDDLDGLHTIEIPRYNLPRHDTVQACPGDAIVPERWFFGIEPRVSFLCQRAESPLVPRRFSPLI